jgi:hypothetical protein
VILAAMEETAEAVMEAMAMEGKLWRLQHCDTEETAEAAMEAVILAARRRLQKRRWML